MTDFSKLSDGEINLLVAEALGWTGIMEFQDRTYGGKYFRGDCPFLNENGDLDTEPRRVPEFTTDPAAWWQLVDALPHCITITEEYLGSRVHDFTIKKREDDYAVGYRYAPDYEAESFHDDWFFIGTIGRAICECFLKWKATEGGK